jgi:hypothetical protein
VEGKFDLKEVENGVFSWDGCGGGQDGDEDG